MMKLCRRNARISILFGCGRSLQISHMLTPYPSCIHTQAMVAASWSPVLILFFCLLPSCISSYLVSSCENVTLLICYHSTFTWSFSSRRKHLVASTAPVSRFNPFLSTEQTLATGVCELCFGIQGSIRKQSGKSRALEGHSLASFFETFQGLLLSSYSFRCKSVPKALLIRAAYSFAGTKHFNSSHKSAHRLTVVRFYMGYLAKLIVYFDTKGDVGRQMLSGSGTGL